MNGTRVVRVFGDESCEMRDIQSGKRDLQEHAAERTHETDVRRHCGAKYPPTNT